MAVGVDDAGDGFVAAMNAHEIEARARCLRRDQRVDDDVTLVAFDEGDVGKIEIAHLIDALGDFEETVNFIELRLTP